MRSVNKVIIVGNLVRDAEQKYTPSGAAVASFSVATSHRWKDKQSEEWKDRAEYHNVVLWRSEGVSTYLLKGKPVYIEGRLSTRSYEKDGQKRYVTEVIADNLILLGDGGRAQTTDSKPDTDEGVPF